MKKVNLLLFLLLVMFFVYEPQAQTKGKNASVFVGEEFLTSSKPVRRNDIGYWSVGGQAGIVNYFGDLNPLSQYVSTDLSKSRPSIGIQATRKWSPRIHTRFSLVWSRLIGDDSQAADPMDERSRYRYIRNAHFRNDVFEFSVSATWDLRASNRIYYRRKHTPYLVLGVGVFYHNPKAKAPEEFGGKWTALRPLGTEGQFANNAEEQGYEKPYSLFQPVVPIGLGMRFRLSDRWDLAVEMGMRMVFTDYLDDVSGDYADPADLTPLGRAMADRTLDEVSAFSGENRVENVEFFLNNVSALRTGSDFVILPDGTPYPTINGYSTKGDKRGEPGQEDIYIVTGFHLNYIVEAGLRCPKFGKRRRR